MVPSETELTDPDFHTQHCPCPLPALASPAHPFRRKALRMATLGTGHQWFFFSLGCGHWGGGGPVIPMSIPPVASARPPLGSPGSQALSPVSASCSSTSTLDADQRRSASVKSAEFPYLPDSLAFQALSHSDYAMLHCYPTSLNLKILICKNWTKTTYTDS